MVAAFAYGGMLGWWAGCRYQRARDAARYAQIEARRLHVRARLAEQAATSGALLSHAQTRGVAAMKDGLIVLERLREQSAASESEAGTAVTVTLDYQFAVAALRDAGYVVTVAQTTH